MTYQEQVEALESEGLSTSDAQAIVDAQNLKSMEPKMDTLKPQRLYWAITQNHVPLFKGTFNQCWKQLMAMYGDATLKSLERRQIEISRIA